MSETNVVKDESGVAQRSELQPVVKRLDSDELLDRLACMLGIAAHESAEVRWNDEYFKMKVIRRAIEQLDIAWNGEDRGKYCIDKDAVAEKVEQLELENILAKWASRRFGYSAPPNVQLRLVDGLVVLHVLRR